jgi:hypothetical protein
LDDGKDHFRPITGLPISTYFSTYKFQWLLENVPKVGGMDYLFCWSGLGGVRRWAVALVLVRLWASELDWLGWGSGAQSFLGDAG